MKKLSKFIMALIFLCLTYFDGYSQDSPLVEQEPESYKLLIPELGVLIDSALANNGMLNYRIDEIEVKKANLKAKRRNWTRNFGIQADTRYGTFDNFSNNVSGPNTVTLASTTTQFNYGVGLYLKIPVFDVFNRRSEIKQAKTEISQAKNLVKFQADEIRETVIRQYEDLLLRQNLFEIQAINLGDAKANKAMAEKEFRNGIIPVYEYVRILDITSGIAREYEKAKSELMLSKKLLENLTGMVIN
ncbi:TolC family protein [Psychroserpens sp.]|uniref:TolC family protein n=1 Tax=Psychroserpens sp. TaxID=2020870 RepID=UPI001B2E2304|nr:TolC family protein [Psychroserpens sp.]MBO6605708.1 TolC family protein [Psychroserpens sp.]MBO6632684.1 TolC family protein [Psychroserpens sp.]MBO6652921.1 TolC family protein [Psychroserpens sp.]MBO6681307.1 TolC family protein [Psychroserpens sp.]MBO6749082.1 TolC family protein [Psychroserpens sp.]